MFIIRILISIVIGAIVGSIAGGLMDKGSKGFLGNAVIGIIGGAVGGWIGNLLNTGHDWLSSIVLAVIGSCLVIFILSKFK